MKTKLALLLTVIILSFNNYYNDNYYSNDCITDIQCENNIN